MPDLGVGSFAVADRGVAPPPAEAPLHKTSNVDLKFVSDMPVLKSAEELKAYNNSEEESLEKVIKAIADTGCNMLVCGQQVVIAREGLLAKMKRCVVVPPNVEAETADLHKHLVKTLLDQAHLNPLPPNDSAAYSKHHHALWLHPAPEVLVLAARGNQYDVEYEDTLAFNPGAFATTFSWQVYYPETRKAEVSSLSE